jgi:plasmid stabilization system protein ParE
MTEVIWHRSAYDRLVRLVRRYPDRAAEFAAAIQETIDTLSADPTGTGESRDGPYRIAVFGPLVVTFRPDPATARVYVTRVRLPAGR